MSLTHGIYPKWVGDANDPYVSLYPHWVEVIEIIDDDIERGAPGGDELDRRRREREEKEVIDVAIALIVSGVLDELI
jgi:hypothetical protein